MITRTETEGRHVYRDQNGKELRRSQHIYAYAHLFPASLQHPLNDPKDKWSLTNNPVPVFEGSTTFKIEDGTMQINIRGLKALATSKGYTARMVDGEYQIYPKGTNADHPSTYFTDCIDDAAGTLRKMFDVS